MFGKLFFARRHQSKFRRKKYFRSCQFDFERVAAFESLEPRRVLSTLPAGFAESFIAGGIDPAGEDFAPDGRLFVAVKTGQVRIIQNDNLQATPFWSVAV